MGLSLQGLTETLYSKSQAASTRQRKEFVPKTLEDLGIETRSAEQRGNISVSKFQKYFSCDLNLTAPHLERQLRGSGSSR